MREELAGRADKNSEEVIPREFIVQYLVGGYLAVLIWWLDRGARLPVERMDAMFRRLASGGISVRP